MWRTLGITENDWLLTPQSVKHTLLVLHHQSHSANLRLTAYHAKVAAVLPPPAAQLHELHAQLARQLQQIAALEKQVAETAELKAESESLKASINGLQAQHIALKERLRQDSHNSSRPPSSDAWFRQRKGKHQPSGRQHGAQPGHVGVGRKLLPLEKVDMVVELRSESCRACAALLLGLDSAPARRQITEIRNGRAAVTEYQQHRVRCLACGALNREVWPAAAAGGAFGATVLAITAYLTGRLHLSQRDVVEALHELFAVKIGLGSIAAVQRQVSNALAQPVAEAVEFVKKQAAQYVDETGWSERKTNQWLWVNSTKNVTIFSIQAGRSQDEAHKIIDADELGVVTTDRYGGYNFVQPWRRQLCWAHLKRDFTAIAERDDRGSKAVGEELLAETNKVFEFYHKVRDGTFLHCRLRAAVEPVKQRIKELLESGTEVENTKTAQTCHCIQKQYRSLWTFVRVAAVEPTNNRAERVLRRAVLWRRKSFGTQSEAGSRFVERILSVVTSLRQQRRSVLGFLTTACQERIAAAGNGSETSQQLSLLLSCN